MLDHIVEQAREQDIFSHQDTPTEQQVLAGFMYHGGWSFRWIEPVVDCCFLESIRCYVTRRSRWWDEEANVFDEVDQGFGPSVFS